MDWSVENVYFFFCQWSLGCLYDLFFSIFSEINPQRVLKAIFKLFSTNPYHIFFFKLKFENQRAFK